MEIIGGAIHLNTLKMSVYMILKEADTFMIITKEI